MALDRHRARRAAVRRDGPGDRDLRRVGGEHDGGRRVVRRAAPRSSAGSATTSSARCSPTTSAPRACSLDAAGRRRPADRPLPDHRHARRRAHDEHVPRASARARPDDVDASSSATRRSRTSRATSGTSPRRRRRSASRRGSRTRPATVALTLSDPFCVDRHRDEFLDLVEDEVDILFANEAEICSLYEVDDFDDALQRVRTTARSPR